MAVLSVNVNKIATLRNSRGGNNPDVLQTALDIESFGAEGITVHPRPDERHIRRRDVYELAEKVSVEFNIEGYPSDDFLGMVKEVRPTQCTLVPDPPEVLTSNSGWDIFANEGLLRRVVGELKEAGVRVSLFFDPYDFKGAELEAVAEMGADRIELYTEAFALAYSTENQVQVTGVYKKAAEEASRLGIGVNAGHDLDLRNLRYLVSEIPQIDEVSIGHALVCDALYVGLETTVQKYLKCLS